jgi:hypothetical protein
MSIVGPAIDLIGFTIYLKGISLGTVSMIIVLVINLIGFTIYLKGVALGTMSTIIDFVIDLIGLAFHGLRLVLEFSLP